METLALANLPHYSVGGSIHLIVNNQIGYTTELHNARSTNYCSDIGKMINAPIIHVNGDEPEEVVYAMKLATEYRMMFKKDIIVDLVCYRRRGHNELDDPFMTQPIMYNKIKKMESVVQKYQNKLLNDKVIDNELVETVRTTYLKLLNDKLAEAKNYSPPV